MTRLIIEEDVRLQYAEDVVLLNAAKKEGIVWHNTPTLKCVQCTLVRGRIPSRHYRDA